MKTAIPENHSKLTLPIRIISVILLISFLAQDIVWAYPDIYNDKLAVTGLQNDLTTARMRAAAIIELIEKRSALRDKLDMVNLEDIIFWQRSSESAFKGVKFNGIKYDNALREVRIELENEGLLIRYFDSNYLYADVIPPGYLDITTQIVVSSVIHPKNCIQRQVLKAAKLLPPEVSPSSDHMGDTSTQNKAPSQGSGGNPLLEGLSFMFSRQRDDPPMRLLKILLGFVRSGPFFEQLGRVPQKRSVRNKAKASKKSDVRKIDGYRVSALIREILAMQESHAIRQYRGAAEVANCIMLKDNMPSLKEIADHLGWTKGLVSGRMPLAKQILFDPQKVQDEIRARFAEEAETKKKDYDKTIDDAREAAKNRKLQGSADEIIFNKADLGLAREQLNRLKAQAAAFMENQEDGGQDAKKVVEFNSLLVRISENASDFTDIVNAGVPSAQGYIIEARKLYGLLKNNYRVNGKLSRRLPETKSSIIVTGSTKSSLNNGDVDTLYRCILRMQSGVFRDSVSISVSELYHYLEKEWLTGMTLANIMNKADLVAALESDVFIKHLKRYKYDLVWSDDAKAEFAIKNTVPIITANNASRYNDTIVLQSNNAANIEDELPLEENPWLIYIADVKDFSQNTINILEDMGFYTLGHLCKITSKRLEELCRRNNRVLPMSEVKKALARYGFSLGEKDSGKTRVYGDGFYQPEFLYKKLKEVIQDNAVGLGRTNLSVAQAVYIEGKTVDEVARVIGLSEGSVKRILIRVSELVRKWADTHFGAKRVEVFRAMQLLKHNAHILRLSADPQFLSAHSYKLVPSEEQLCQPGGLSKVIEGAILGKEYSVDKLSELLRNTARRFYFDGMTQKDIASEEGVMEDAIKDRLYKVRSITKEWLCSLSTTRANDIDRVFKEMRKKSYAASEKPEIARTENDSFAGMLGFGPFGKLKPFESMGLHNLKVDVRLLLGKTPKILTAIRDTILYLILDLPFKPFESIDEYFVARKNAEVSRICKANDDLRMAREDAERTKKDTPPDTKGSFVDLSYGGKECRVYYEKQGSGEQAVILIHGVGESVKCWDKVVTPLAEKFTVYTIDLPGFGNSGKPDVSYTIDSYVKTLYEFMDKKGIDSAVIAGHSLGGAITMAFSDKYPEKVKSQILVNYTPFRMKSWIVSLYRLGNICNLVYHFPDLVIKKLALWLFKLCVYDKESYRNYVLPDIKRSYIKALAQTSLIVLNLDQSSFLESNTRPTLLISTTKKKKDMTWPLSLAEDTEYLLRIYDTDVALSQVDSGHFSVIENPKAVSDAILKWASEGYKGKAKAAPAQENDVSQIDASPVIAFKEIHASDTNAVDPFFQDIIIKQIQAEAVANGFDYNATFSTLQQFKLHESFRYLIGNVGGHEFGIRYRENLPSIFIRIYQTSKPTNGLRVEFWGPARFPLPNQLTSKMWYTSRDRPWEGIAAKEARSKNTVAGAGIQRFFDALDDVRAKDDEPIRVGWREDLQREGPKSGGHIIAMHIPLKRRPSPATSVQESETRKVISLSSAEILREIIATLSAHFTEEDINEIRVKHSLDRMRWRMAEVPIDILFRDNHDGLRISKVRNGREINSYVSKAPDTFPPVVVFVKQNDPGISHVLFGGYIRVNAARERGEKTILAYVGEIPAAPALEIESLPQVPGEKRDLGLFPGGQAHLYHRPKPADSKMAYNIVRTVSKKEKWNLPKIDKELKKRLSHAPLGIVAKFRAAGAEGLLESKILDVIEEEKYDIPRAADRFHTDLFRLEQYINRMGLRNKITARLRRALPPERVAIICLERQWNILEIEEELSRTINVSGFARKLAALGAEGLFRKRFLSVLAEEKYNQARTGTRFNVTEKEVYNYVHSMKLERVIEDRMIEAMPTDRLCEICESEEWNVSGILKKVSEVISIKGGFLRLFKMRGAEDIFRNKLKSVLEEEHYSVKGTCKRFGIMPDMLYGYIADLGLSDMMNKRPGIVKKDGKVMRFPIKGPDYSDYETAARELCRRAGFKEYTPHNLELALRGRSNIPSAVKSTNWRLWNACTGENSKIKLLSRPERRPDYSVFEEAALELCRRAGLAEYTPHNLELALKDENNASSVVRKENPRLWKACGGEDSKIKLIPRKSGETRKTSYSRRIAVLEKLFKNAGMPFDPARTYGPEELKPVLEHPNNSIARLKETLPSLLRAAQKEKLDLKPGPSTEDVDPMVASLHFLETFELTEAEAVELWRKMIGGDDKARIELSERFVSRVPIVLRNLSATNRISISNHTESRMSKGMEILSIFLSSKGLEEWDPDSGMDLLEFVDQNIASELKNVRNGYRNDRGAPISLTWEALIEGADQRWKDAMEYETPAQENSVSPSDAPSIPPPPVDMGGNFMPMVESDRFPEAAETVRTAWEFKNKYPDSREHQSAWQVLLDDIQKLSSDQQQGLFKSLETNPEVYAAARSAVSQMITSETEFGSAPEPSQQNESPAMIDHIREKRSITVRNTQGIHARPCVVISGVAWAILEKLKFGIYIKNGEKGSPAEDKFTLMGLGAHDGDILDVSVQDMGPAIFSTEENSMRKELVAILDLFDELLGDSYALEGATGGTKKYHGKIDEINRMIRSIRESSSSVAIPEGATETLRSPAGTNEPKGEVGPPESEQGVRFTNESGEPKDMLGGKKFYYKTPEDDAASNASSSKKSSDYKRLPSEKGKQRTRVSKWDLLMQFKEALPGLSEEVVVKLKQEPSVGERRRILVDAGIGVAEAVDGKFFAMALERFLQQRVVTAPASILSKHKILRYVGKGRDLIAYAGDDFDLLVKMSRYPDKVKDVLRFWIGQGYELAKERLNGLAVPTMIIDATDGSKKPFSYLLEKVGVQKTDLAIVQKKVVPILDRLKYLAKEGRAEEVKELIDRYKKFVILMFRRGVMDFDFTNPYCNFGVDLETGKIYVFDFGDLAGDEANVGMYLEKVKVTNKYFYDDLREHVSKEAAAYFWQSPIQIDDYFTESGESLFGIDLKPEDMDSFKMSFPLNEDQVRHIFMNHNSVRTTNESGAPKDMPGGKKFYYKTPKVEITSAPADEENTGAGLRFATASGVIFVDDMGSDKKAQRAGELILEAASEGGIPSARIKAWSKVPFKNKPGYRQYFTSGQINGTHWVIFGGKLTDCVARQVQDVIMNTAETPIPASTRITLPLQAITIGIENDHGFKERLPERLAGYLSDVIEGNTENQKEFLLLYNAWAIFDSMVRMEPKLLAATRSKMLTSDKAADDAALEKETEQENRLRELRKLLREEVQITVMKDGKEIGAINKGKPRSVTINFITGSIIGVGVDRPLIEESAAPAQDVTRAEYQKALVEKPDNDKEERIIARVMDYLSNNKDKAGIKVISYGSGAGDVLRTLKERVRGLYEGTINVVTEAADYDPAALDLARKKNEECAPENRIDGFRLDNLLKLADHKNEYDIIILEDVLHEVFSFALERNPDGSIQDVEKNKNEVIRVFADLHQQLSPGGILIIEDRFKPNHNEDSIVKVKFSKAAIREGLFERYFKGFSYNIAGKDRSVGPFNAIPVKKEPRMVEESTDGMVVEIVLGDYLHFLSHLRVLLSDKNKEGNYSRWEIEKNEVHCFFKQKEYEAAFKQAGFETVDFGIPLRKKPVTDYVEVLNPEDFRDIIDEDGVGFKISSTIVARKRKLSSVVPPIVPVQESADALAGRFNELRQKLAALLKSGGEQQARQVCDELAAVSEKITASVNRYYESPKVAGEYQHLQQQAPESWFRDPNSFAMKNLQRFVTLLKERKGKKIADIGMGGGWDTEFLRQQGFDATGIDASEAMVKNARVLYPSSHYEVASASELSSVYGDDSLDGAWAQASLYHLPYYGENSPLDRSVGDISRKLKKGGLLYLGVHGGFEGKMELEERGAGLGKRYSQNLTKIEVEEMLTRNGFRILEIVQAPQGKRQRLWVTVFAEKTAETAPSATALLRQPSQATEGFGGQAQKNDVSQIDESRTTHENANIAIPGVLQDIQAALRQVGIHDLEILLFGSYADNKENPQDLDLILTIAPGTSQEEARDIIQQIGTIEKQVGDFLQEKGYREIQFHDLNPATRENYFRLWKAREFFTRNKLLWFVGGDHIHGYRRPGDRIITKENSQPLMTWDETAWTMLMPALNDHVAEAASLDVQNFVNGVRNLDTTEDYMSCLSHVRSFCQKEMHSKKISIDRLYSALLDSIDYSKGIEDRANRNLVVAAGVVIRYIKAINCPFSYITAEQYYKLWAIFDMSKQHEKYAVLALRPIKAMIVGSNMSIGQETKVGEIRGFTMRRYGEFIASLGRKDVRSALETNFEKELWIEGILRDEKGCVDTLIAKLKNFEKGSLSYRCQFTFLLMAAEYSAYARQAMREFVIPQEELYIDKDINSAREAWKEIFGNENNTRAFLKTASALRIIYPYDLNTNDDAFAYESDQLAKRILPPLQYARENNITFKIGKNLYLCPITESFRRHIIYGTNNAGDISFKLEVVIPGKMIDRQEIGKERFTIAKEMCSAYPKKEYCVRPVGIKEYPNGSYDLYEGSIEFTAESPLRVVGFEYEDGKRLSNYNSDMIKALAEQLSMSRYELERRIITQVAELTAAIHAMRYIGNVKDEKNRDLTDCTTENFRLIVLPDKKDIKVVLVADFGVFQKEDLYTDPEAAREFDRESTVHGIMSYPVIRSLEIITALHSLDGDSLDGDNQTRSLFDATYDAFLAELAPSMPRPPMHDDKKTFRAIKEEIGVTAEGYRDLLVPGGAESLPVSTVQNWLTPSSPLPIPGPILERALKLHKEHIVAKQNSEGTSGDGPKDAAPAAPEVKTDQTPNAMEGREKAEKDFNDPLRPKGTPRGYYQPDKNMTGKLAEPERPATSVPPPIYGDKETFRAIKEELGVTAEGYRNLLMVGRTKPLSVNTVQRWLTPSYPDVIPGTIMERALTLRREHIAAKQNSEDAPKKFPADAKVVDAVRSYNSFVTDKILEIVDTLAKPVRFKELRAELFSRYRIVISYRILNKIFVDRPDIAERAEFKFPAAGSGKSKGTRSPKRMLMSTAELSFEEMLDGFMYYVRELRDPSILRDALPKVESIPEETTKKAIILYADCILKQGPILDLEETIKKAAILNGGTVIIYGNKASRATILEKIIKRANNSINVIWISQAEVATRFNRADANEIDELRGLIDCAKSKPELSGKTLMGVVKGPAMDNYKIALREFLNERKVVIVSFESDYDLYSTYDAMRAIFDAQKANTPKSYNWVIDLKPSSKQNIEKLDKDYFRKLKELETKA